MSTNKSNKPELRFKGFSDDWEQRKLKDMCTIITKQTGFDYSATIKPSLVTTKENDTYSFIQNKDFKGTNINLDTDFYIPISVAEKYPKITLDQPSLLISISGRIGNVGLYLLNSKAFIGGAVGICKLKNIEDGKTALYELLAPDGQKYFNSLIKASSHANITVEDIRDIEVLLPKDEVEKKKLNSYFFSLDHLITLHQRKCDNLKIIKKSMLDNLFPKNGEKVPKWRFKGFNNDWEQRKLSDLVDVYSGMDYKHLSIGNIPVFGTGGYMLSVDRALSYDRNAIGIGRKGTIDKPYILKAPFWTVDTLFYCIPRDEGTLNFNYDLFQCIDWKQKDESTGVPSLSKVAINDTDVMVPKTDEQKKIGYFFEELDLVITLHQSEVERLKKAKQFFLDKMFI